MVMRGKKKKKVGHYGVSNGLSGTLLTGTRQIECVLS